MTMLTGRCGVPTILGVSAFCLMRQVEILELQSVNSNQAVLSLVWNEGQILRSLTSVVRRQGLGLA